MFAFIRKHPWRLTIPALILQFLSYEPFGLWPLAWLAPIPLFLAAWDGSVRIRTVFLRFFGMYMVFHILMYHWIWNFFKPGMPFVVTALSLYYATGWTLISLVHRKMPSQRLPASILALILVELCRAGGELSLSWGLFGHSQSGSPLFRQLASLFGEWGISLVLLMTSAALADRLYRGAGWKKYPFRITALAAFMLILAYSIARLASGINVRPFRKDIALIQTGADSAAWKRNFSDQSRTAFRLALEAAAPGRLLVFPETVFPFNITGYYREYRKNPDPVPVSSSNLLLPEYSLLQISATAFALPQILGTRLLLPVPLHDNKQAFNSVLLLEPDRPAGRWGGRYDKRKLVPFGEFLPWQPLFSVIEPLMQKAGVERFTAGKSGHPLSVGRWKIGILICYEDMFPELAAAYAADGAGALINVTSDSRFKSPIASGQHLGGARLSAVASGLPLYRAANTGITCLITPDGRVTDRLPPDKAGILTVPRLYASGKTFYVWAGYRIRDILWLVSAVYFAFIAVFLTRRRNR